MNILFDLKKEISSSLLESLSKKLSNGIVKLYNTRKNGGNPFLFSFIIGKNHFINSSQKTASTDGRNFYWNPDFLEKLSIDRDHNELGFVLMHEVYHLALLHCTKNRMKKNHKKWNIAVDFIVNGLIYEDLRKLNMEYEIFGYTFSTIKATLKDVIERKHLEDPDGKMILYFDVNEDGSSGLILQDGMTADRVYDLIPEDEDENYCSCSSSCVDDHIESIDKDSIVSDLEKARQFSEAFSRGSTPRGMEEILKELYEPTLTMEDLVKSAIFRKKLNTGMKNDRSRYRKRFLGLSDPLYYPKKYDHNPKWVCLLDTSGSMSDTDIAHGLSQLKCLGSSIDGVIVPCDAEPYWESCTNVNNLEDLQRTVIKGRGGTAFSSFFKELPQRMNNYDVVIVITDGYCEEIDLKLQPRVDVVWIITSNYKDFSPTFGRVAPLLPLI